MTHRESEVYFDSLTPFVYTDRALERVLTVGARANSSAEEHLLYTQGVAGSKPASPTIMRRRGVAGLTYVPVTHEIEGSNPFASASTQIAGQTAGFRIVARASGRSGCRRCLKAGCGSSKLRGLSYGRGLNCPKSYASIILRRAAVAQLVEQRTENPRVASSILACGTTRRKWLSGRASPCQGEGREFESRLPLQRIRRHSQVVRQRSAKPLPPVRIRVSPPYNGRLAQMVRAHA